jgi:AcrR family transcriptional regulator
VAAETRERIVTAALATLREEGFAGTSARAIATRGGFNQALIFYHFGTLNDLLLAALDRTSEERLRRYREALDGVRGLPSTMRIAGELYAEDRASGHITVLCELVAGSATAKGLGPQIVERMEPWLRLTEETLNRALSRSPLRRLVPVKELSYPIVAMYLGVELLAHLDGDHGRADALFATVTRTTNRLSRLLGGRAGGEARRAT